MNVRIRLVGVVGNPPEPVWPEGWPPPREGETVWNLPGPGGIALPPMRVRPVAWYPHGDGHGSSPFVYVVLGP